MLFTVHSRFTFDQLMHSLGIEPIICLSYRKALFLPWNLCFWLIYGKIRYTHDPSVSQRCVHTRYRSLGPAGLLTFFIWLEFSLARTRQWKSSRENLRLVPVVWWGFVLEKAGDNRTGQRRAAIERGESAEQSDSCERRVGRKRQIILIIIQRLLAAAPVHE